MSKLGQVAERPTGADHGHGVRGDVELVDVLADTAAVAASAGDLLEVVGRSAGAFAVPTADRVVHGAGGFGPFGGVLGDIAGYLSVVQGGVAAGAIGDGPQVELLAPAHRDQVAEGVGVGNLDGRPLGRSTNGGIEQLDGGPGRRRAIGFGSVEPEDGVEMDHTPGLVFGHLGHRYLPHTGPGPLADAEQSGHGPVDQDGRASPQGRREGVPDDGPGVVVAGWIERLADSTVIGGVPSSATVAAMRVASLRATVGVDHIVMNRTKRWRGECGENLGVGAGGGGHVLAADQAGADQLVGVGAVGLRTRRAAGSASVPAGHEQPARPVLPRCCSWTAPRRCRPGSCATDRKDESAHDSRRRPRPSPSSDRNQDQRRRRPGRR